MNNFKVLFDTPERVSRTDTSADSADPDPDDVWAFTDPDARDRYARDGRLRALEHNIRYEVMRGGPWQPEELEYKREIRRLLRQGTVTDKGTYWFTPFLDGIPGDPIRFTHRGGQGIPLPNRG